MLSIGTGTSNYRPSSRVSERDGAVDWLSDGRLLLTLIAVQQQHVQAMMEDRLGDRYLHIDGEWPRNADLGIDIATPAVATLLSGLARQALAGVDTRALEPFMGARKEPKSAPH